jgi:DNA polymerase-3 subunit delta'
MSFSDFPDQQQPIGLLQRSLEKGRLGHAYLFTGAELPTLEAVAGTLAKTLNCEQPPKVGMAVPLDCCDLCRSCRQIEDRIHPDIQWVRPESKSRVITVDQIRNLLQIVHLKPTEAACKVIVIVAADRLNVEGANAFLKTLEEPPPKTVFILLSAEPQQMLETIISRCLRLTFSGGRANLSAEDQSWLENFAAATEGSGSGLLPRYKLLGTILARLAELKGQIEKSLSARSPLQKYDDIDAKLQDKWESELNAAIEAEYRQQRSELLRLVQGWLRDVWLITHAMPVALLSFPILQTVSAKVAARIDGPAALENLKTMEQTQRLLRTNVQESLALEVGLLKLKL